jgi:hypothetical protein
MRTVPMSIALSYSAYFDIPIEQKREPVYRMVAWCGKVDFPVNKGL